MKSRIAVANDQLPIPSYGDVFKALRFAPSNPRDHSGCIADGADGAFSGVRLSVCPRSKRKTA